MATLINWLSALAVRFTPTGGIAATTVQDAIAEVDAETVKLTSNQSISGNKTFTSNVVINSPTTVYNPPLVANVAAYGIPSFELRDPISPSSNPSLRFINSSLRYASIGFSSGADTGITFGNLSTGSFTLNVNGVFNVANATASTSTTTGCATFAGGIGVAGNIWSGGTATANILNFGLSAIKGTLNSNVVGSVNTISFGSTTQGAHTFEFPALGSITGANDNELRLWRGGGEFLRLLAPRGGVSGQNNIYLFDIAGNTTPAARPLRFRFLTAGEGGAAVDSMQLNNTGTVNFLGTGSSTSTTTGCATFAGGIGIQGAGFFGGNVIVSGVIQGSLRTTTPTPVNASSAGSPGDVAYDANYIYVCTAVNTWKRSALTTW